MLNLTVKPGEYFVIGEDIRVIFAGGTANNARVMIDAPRSYNIVRGKVLEQEDSNLADIKGLHRTEKTEQPNRQKRKKYYVEPEIPKERMEGFIRQQKAKAAD